MAPQPQQQQQAANPLGAAGDAGLFGAIGTGLFTLIGTAIAQGDFEKARQLQAQALEQLSKLDPQQLAQVRAEVGESAFKTLTEPPEGRAAQMRALQRLESMGMGETPEDAAAYARAQAEAAQVERGLRQAALQRLAQRGAGATSGVALAAQQEAAQQATQLASMRGLEQAAEARRRALEAIRSASGAAGQLRSADYQAASERARAQDIINQFNAQQRMRQAEQLYGAQERQAERMAGGLRQQAGEYEQAGGRTVATSATVGRGLGSIADVALKVASGA